MAPRIERAVHSVGIETALAHAFLVGEVDDPKDFLRRPAEGNAVGRRGNDVGFAVHLEALVLVFRPVDLVSRIGNRISGLPGLFPHSV